MHETSVHRWDVERALDCTSPISAEVAADGVDEFLDVFVRTRGKQTLTEALVLHTTAPPLRSWTLRLAEKPGRIDVESGAAEDVAVSIGAPPEGLLLHLWGRITFDESKLVLVGDAGVARSLIR